MASIARLALLAACLLGGGLGAGLAVPAPVLAQGAGSQDGANAPKQIALTQAEIDNLVAAQNDVRAAQGGGDQDKADPAADAKLTAAAKKHGFANLAQFSDVSYSVGLVMGGLDPETKEFVGPTAVIKKQIAQVQADKSMPPKDRKEALSELKEALQQGEGEKPEPGNIALVKANFEKLAAGMQQSE